MKFWPSRCGEVEEIRLVVSSGHPTSKARAFTTWRLMMMMMVVRSRRKKKKMLMMMVMATFYPKSKASARSSLWRNM